MQKGERKQRTGEERAGGEVGMDGNDASSRKYPVSEQDIMTLL